MAWVLIAILLIGAVAFYTARPRENSPEIGTKAVELSDWFYFNAIPASAEKSIGAKSFARNLG